MASTYIVRIRCTGLNADGEKLQSTIKSNVTLLTAAFEYYRSLTVKVNKWEFPWDVRKVDVRLFKKEDGQKRVQIEGVTAVKPESVEVVKK